MPKYFFLFEKFDVVLSHSGRPRVPESIMQVEAFWRARECHGVWRVINYSGLV